MIDTAPKRVKVVLVTNIPTPYRVPLFNELNEMLCAKGVDFQVIFGALTYSRRRWQINMSDCRFPYTVLRSRTIRLGNSEKTMFLYSGMLSRMAVCRPDLIVSIGFSWATLKAFFHSFWKRGKYMIWSGSIAARRSMKLKRAYRKILTRRASAYIAYGTLAREYLHSLGAPLDKITIALNTTDTRYFAQVAQAQRMIKNGIEEKKHLLYVGYLSPRKNVMRLLLVARELRRIRADFILDLVGDGDDRSRLEAYVLENGMNGYVVFHGYQQKEQIPSFYSVSDCFLFQTDFDIWGLVLNEAMATGIPCIASIHAGATHDLIEDGVNGFSMDFADSSAVARRIDWILRNPLESKRIGSLAAERIAEKATIERSASDFAAAIMAHISNS